MAANLSPGDAIVVAANTRMDTGPLTISAWIKTNQATANIAFLNRHGTPSSNRGLSSQMNASAGKVRLTGKDSGGTYQLVLGGAVTVNDNTWRHLGLVYNLATTANGNKIYVSGSLDVQGAASAAWDMAPTADFRIGASVDGFWGQYGDLFAEVAWYDAELTADEIVSLAKGFRPPKVRPQNLVCYNPLVASTIELRGLAVSGSASGGWDPHPPVF